jgi:hypothetical protein
VGLFNACVKNRYRPTGTGVSSVPGGRRSDESFRRGLGKRRRSRRILLDAGHIGVLFELQQCDRIHERGKKRNRLKAIARATCALAAWREPPHPLVISRCAAAA